ncbi:MAG TPA: hypothetical protein VFW42_00220 [Fluviicoccus sp.]|nr:hypothetical protein [Fluviicoccus sp.]
MSPQHHLKIAILLLAGSVSLEVTFLAGLFPVNDLFYHGLHLALMGALIASQGRVFLTAGLDDPRRFPALAFAVGAAFTAVGDFVNGALSSVQPVSLKLSWAMLLFGIGYSLYCLAFWHVRRRQAADGFPWVAAVLAVLVVNVVSWLQHVEPLLRGMDLLYYGSCLFNATIYVALPVLAFAFCRGTAYRPGGLLVLCGALLIPFSDLILFATWMPGNPAVPAFPLYAFNWILYFSGQVLVSLFPSLVD